MNKSNNIEKRLGDLDFPEIKLAGHQARLKNGLLTAKRFHSNNLNFLFMLKQVRFAVPALILIVAVICGALYLGLIPGFNKVGMVQAKELIAESQFAIEKLSQEARAQLEKLIKADLSKSLQEAYNAKDLEFVGEEDLSPRSQGNSDNLQNDLTKTIAAATAAFSSESQNEPGNKKMELDNYLVDYNERMTTKIKVLKYTDKDGNKIIIGLNPENLPVMQIKVSENEKN